MLSCVVNHLDFLGLCKGLKLTRNGVSLSHLFFVDDCLIFFEPSFDNCGHLKRALEGFSLYSGQCVNH